MIANLWTRRLTVVLAGTAAGLLGGSTLAFAAGGGGSPPNSGVGMTQAQIQEGIQAQNQLNQSLASSGGITPYVISGAYSYMLGLSVQKQQTGYWCGPASTSESLNWLGFPRTQSQMASIMGTTTAGTNFGQIPYGLNTQTPTGYHWVNLYKGSYSEFNYDTNWSNDMYLDIITKKNRPAIQDTHIYSGSALLHGYGSTTNIWHYLASDGLSLGYSKYIDGYGYTTGGTIHYLDSNGASSSILGAWWWWQSDLETVSYAGNGLTWASQ